MPIEGNPPATNHQEEQGLLHRKKTILKSNKNCYLPEKLKKYFPGLVRFPRRATDPW